MASRFVLDTHALVWYLEGSARLSSAAKAVMDDTKGEMILVLVIACIQTWRNPHQDCDLISVPFSLGTTLNKSGMMSSAQAGVIGPKQPTELRKDIGGG